VSVDLASHWATCTATTKHALDSERDLAGSGIIEPGIVADSFLMGQSSTVGESKEIPR
jgi:hypothetical protein